MAAAPAKGKSKGALLTKKVGPLPVWTWAVLGTVLAYFLYKRFSTGSSANATGQSAPSATPAADSTGLTGGPGTSGDTGGAGAAGVDPTALLSSLGQQNSALQASLLASEANIAQLAGDQLAAYQNGPGGAITGGGGDNGGGANGNGSITPQPGGSNAPRFHYQAVPIGTKDFAARAQAQTNSAKAAGTKSAFGGVTSVIRNHKSGIVTTTYANGRKVEQAPGKTAYVVTTGKGHQHNAKVKIQ